jgi:hypothetical protein
VGDSVDYIKLVITGAEITSDAICERGFDVTNPEPVIKPVLGLVAQLVRAADS